ncbi:HD-GYP domain-containing protein [Niallia oryzisoli]|uniref:HD-GYP domain-containing protein n=1 Tax=Niallia oryzisoli TaxID=1737571 RepID=A0ABZ2CDB0_9BACI
MLVKIDYLIEGCIVAEDVFGKTSYPIIRKNTVLTNQLIDTLNLFLIKSIEVEKTLVNGSPFLPADALQGEFPKEAGDDNPFVGEIGFTQLFLHASQEYFKQFQLWQSGMPIDMAKMRLILLPLLKEAMRKSGELFSLHHLSNNERYPYQHAVAVGLLCGYIADKLKYPKGDIIQAALAGILADCGMAKINPRMLQKKAALSIQEFAEIKNHPKYSYQMVHDLPLLREGAKIAVLQHHERLDGSGYPLSLKSNMIHPIAKIIAVADTYHAMTSERLYRQKQSSFRVLELMKQDHFGKFDLAALQALSSGIINFSIGSKVKLSNGLFGEVLYFSDKSPARPLIKLFDTEEILNLEENRDLYIDEIF